MRYISAKGFPRVALHEEDMVKINPSDRGDDAVVESQQPRPLRVGGLVHGVVACDPGIPLVSTGNVLPKVDDAVLEVNVVPEGGVSGRVVGMPVLILAARAGMQVEDCVDSVLGALVFISCITHFKVLDVQVQSHDPRA
jgi:hypothetical protein